MDEITAKDMLRTEDLSVEEVRSAKIFADFNENEAQEVINTFKKLADIIIKYAQIDR